MKLKNILITGCLVFTITMGLVSCNNELSALPTQEKVDGNLITDAASAQVALNGIYYKYAECMVDNYDVLSTGCRNTQELLPADFAGVIEYFQGHYMLEDHTEQASGNYCSMLWSSFYSTLSATNGVLNEMESAPDSWFTGSRKAQIMGEARFMRALSHYNVLRWFGQYWNVNSVYGAILRTEFATVGKVQKDRSTVKETYDCILEDLDYAIANCPDTNPNYYVNKWVAKGMKARVLMMRGQGTDYSDAAAICKDIIDNGPYTLEDKVEDIFHSKGLNSNEVMFAIKPKENQSNVLEGYYFRSASQWYPTANYTALFENDPRKDWMFDVQVSKNYRGETITETTICKHMLKTNKTASTLEESQYQMRLTEMYLLRAEALVRSGGDKGEAKALLETVLGHAGVTDFSAVENANTDNELLKQLFNETLRNLSFEGGRELEIMMRMPKEIVHAFNPIYMVENTDILPIPANEFKYNKVLQEQNPGYTKE